ncbi:WPP domain-associated protein [Salix suchowensis]|nr:WPP domain-associated protein [Salix suchowensis]
MGGRVKSSITDSTIMSMLHSKMDKAHERVHSKEGAIARLHEISKFYELAVMQLEGCLKFVLEEADSSLESSDEEALGDLAEIKDRLEGRLRETELAISEKDRELTERLENEMKLRQTLELKERELESLRANLELVRTKTEGFEEQVLGNLVSGDGNRDEEFSELKNSVDQQMWNIKQQLDPEDESIDKRRYHGFESLRIEQMSSDIDILKETMGLAFEKMQNAIFLSELEPDEQQLGWTVEKAVIVILLEGFMGDIQENFTAELRRWQKQVSIGLGKHLTDLMKEITCLQDELEPLSMSQRSRESKISLKMKGKSSSEGNISYTPDDFAVRTGKIVQMKELNVEDSEEDSAHYVAKMIKSHETIIRRKSEELESQKLEFLKEKGCAYYRRSEKGHVSPRQRFRDVTAKLGNLLHWRENIDESFRYHGSEDHEETSSTKMLYHFDMKEHAKSHGTDALEKVNSISISHDANEKLHNVIRKLKMEKEETNLQNVIVEDTYITLLEGLIHECCAELRSYDIVILVREGIYEHILEEIVNEWDEKMQGDKIEDQITEEMFYLVSREAMKDCGCTLDSMLTECRHARAERICSEEHTLEGTTREEIFSTFFTEIFVMVVMEAMTETHTISGETKSQDRFRILEDFTSSDKLHTSLDIGKEEQLFQKQDSQPEHVKFENSKRRAIPAMKEHKTPPHIEALKHEELNEFQHARELLTEIDSTSHSVNSEVKKAMEQVAVSKGLLRELRSSLGVAVEDTEMFDDEVKVNLSTSDFTPILEFSQVLMEFKRKVEKKLVLNIVRMEEAIHYLNPLVELVTLQRREDLLYKKAFLRRCENLKRAETEVDLLGDQVDVLLCLLDKIYRTLLHYTPALQQYSEVSDILKMIEEELIGAARASGK